MNQDPFVHLSDLRDELTPIAESTMRFTSDVLAQRDMRVREMGYPADWRQSDDEIARAWRRLISQRAESEDLWVFGYGSLMWDPGFHFAEVRRATIEGYQRRFAMKVEVVTGSPEHPGLALTLERQPGRCEGMAFRIPAHLVEAETEILSRREFVLFNYLITKMVATTPQGEIEVVVLTSDRHDARHVGDLSLAKTANTIAAAKGFRGDNKAYITKLALQMNKLGIEDEYVARLASLIERSAPAG